jgi:hypothetical protein
VRRDDKGSGAGCLVPERQESILFALKQCSELPDVIVQLLEQFRIGLNLYFSDVEKNLLVVLSFQASEKIECLLEKHKGKPADHGTRDRKGD